MTNKLTASLLFLIPCLAFGQQTFRGFRFAIGPRIGTSVFPLLSNNELKPKGFETIRYGLKCEIPLSKSIALDLNYYAENFKHPVSATLLLPELHPSDRTELAFSSMVQSNVQTFTTNVRLYSSYAGYMAPWGRFLSYGIFTSNAVHHIENRMMRGRNSMQEMVYYELPDEPIKTKGYRGMNLSFGEKFYPNASKRFWVEYEFGYGLQFYTIAAEGGVSTFGLKNALNSYAMQKSQLNHIFQINFACGLSY